MPKTPARFLKTHGFTLIEIAIALFIVTLLLGAIIVPLQNQIENRKVTETQKTLDEAEEALIGYAAANGRFPCPASATSNGAENFTDPNDKGTVGKCSDFLTGYLPAATLGLTPVDSNGYAIDAWGNRIRYAVYESYLANPSGTHINYPFTLTNGMRQVTMGNISNSNVNLLYVCASGTGVTSTTCGSGGTAAMTLASNAPVVIWSLGANAKTTGSITYPSLSVDERENQDNDRVFVSHTLSKKEGNEFDDLVVWISPNTLFNRLIAAGQLP